jgi:hypothetical protein
MYDLIFIVACLSTSHVLTEFEQIHIFNEVVDENIDEYSSDNGSIFDSDYSELLTPEITLLAIVGVIMVVMNKQKET